MGSNDFAELVGLDQFQTLASETNQLNADLRNEIDPDLTLKRLVPLLGMAGEVGSLLVEFKKYVRDGDAHPLFADRVSEELGDILWYLASTATNFDHKLSDVAAANLRKTRRRWPASAEVRPEYVLFDADCEVSEQIPRLLTVEIAEVRDEDDRYHAELLIEGAPAGDHLRDNSLFDDGYRFHDIFHLANAAILGWSPVLRGKLLNPQRKRSNANTDEVEDGGRAIVIEEAIVAYVWEYAEDHRFFDGITTVDYGILKTIDQLTANLEVSARQLYEWEEAILAGYRVFRIIQASGRGTIEIDLINRTIEVVA